MTLGRLAHYEVLERIGEGGMGVVYRARDTRLRRIVALKIVRPDLAGPLAERGRILREACLEASLNHENIAICHDVIEAPLDDELSRSMGLESGGGTSVLVICMEYIPGESLRERMQRQPLGVTEAVRLTIRIGNGLDAAHHQGVVHRDLKPANIRITPEGKLKILDFGIARHDAEIGDDDRTAEWQSDSSIVQGTPPYMAPEQAEGRPVDKRSDLFALGVILYEMVTGHRPFPGRTITEVQRGIWEGAPPAMSKWTGEADPELERICRKLLAHDPNDRYQTARGAVVDLEQLVGDGSRGTTAGTGRGHAERPPRPRRERWLWLSAMVLVVIALSSIPTDRLRCSSGPATDSAEASLSVQRFENLGEAAGEAVAQGIRSSIITELLRVDGLRLVSISGVRDAGQQSPDQLSRSLGVEYLLEGTVLSGAKQFRLQARLLEGKSGQILWGESYEGSLGDLFRIQGQVAKDLATALSLQLTPGSAGEGPSPGSETLDTVQLWVRARGLLERISDPVATEEATRLLENAVQRDPEFAPAHASLSLALARSGDVTALERAEREALRAVELDSELPDAHLALAWVYDRQGHADRAEAVLRGVLELAPDLNETYFQFAVIDESLGDLEGARRNLRRAIELGHDEWRSWNLLGAVYHRQGDYNLARDAYREAIELAPEGVTWPYENLAALDIEQGRYEQAEAIISRIPDEYMSVGLVNNLGVLYYGRGEMDKAERYFLKVCELEPENPIAAYNVGDLLVHVGKDEEARGWYGRAVGAIDAVLENDPRNLELQLARAVFLAKAGDCDQGSSALADLAERLTPTPLESYRAAIVHAACGRDTDALEAIAAGIEGGLPREVVRGEDAFAGLRDDPRYVDLVEPTPEDLAPGSR